MRYLILPFLSGLLLAACEQAVELTPLQADPPPASENETETVAETEPPVTDAPSRGIAATQKRATIDWVAAQSDFAARVKLKVGPGWFPYVVVLSFHDYDTEREEEVANGWGVGWSLLWFRW